MLMLIVDLSFVTFMFSATWKYSNMIINCLGLILTFFQLFCYITTAIINPGIPKKIYEAIGTAPNHEGNYRQCIECGLWYDCSKGTFHCNECDICVEGYDHHCPWTSKCIGKNNIKWFYSFLTMTFVCFGYFIIAILLSDSMRKRKK